MSHWLVKGCESLGLSFPLVNSCLSNPTQPYWCPKPHASPLQRSVLVATGGTRATSADTVSSSSCERLSKVPLGGIECGDNQLNSPLHCFNLGKRCQKWGKRVARMLSKRIHERPTNSEARRHWNNRHCSTATLWVCRIEPDSSGRAESTLECRALSPALILVDCQLHTLGRESLH